MNYDWEYFKEECRMQIEILLHFPRYNTHFYENWEEFFFFGITDIPD